jgi:hypothetical protein
VVLPRGVLDLVTMRDDGQAILPKLGDDLVSKWWTKAHQAYMAQVCDYLRTTAIQRTSDNVPTRLFVTSSASQSETESGRNLGMGAMYDIREDAESYALPIRRVARLRLNEALNLQHSFHARAARIGLAAHLGHDYMADRLRVANRDGREIGVIPATRVTNDKYPRKNPLAVLVHPLTFADLASKAPGLEELVEEAKACPGFFDVWAASRPGMQGGQLSCRSEEAGYMLKPLGRTAAGSSGGRGAESSGAPATG